MAKDYFQSLAKLITEKNWTKLGTAGQSALTDIQAEVTALRRQEVLIHNTLDSYAAKMPHSNNGTAPSDTELTRSSDDRRSRTEPGDDGLTSKQRSDQVKRSAIILVHHGKTIISTADVLAELRSREIVFKMKRPNSMVGTVLRSMPEFRRLGMDQFEFVGRKQHGDAEAEN